MPDTLDQDVITEEIDTGSSSSTSSTPSPATEEFSFGSVPIESPVGDSYVSTPSTYVAPKTVAATEDMVSLDNLRAVSSQFDKGCQSFQNIVDGTGLSKEVVMACIKWLRDNGMLSVSNSFYCTIDNVASLQSQLKACVACFSQKK